VAELIGGEVGAEYRQHAECLLSGRLLLVGDKIASARAICSSLRAARALGNRAKLVEVFMSCSSLAENAPDAMVKAEKESREQERLSGPPHHGGPDLSQEGRTSLPTTPAALSRICISYAEAAVEIYEAALASAGGRNSPAAADGIRIPSLLTEARAYGHLGVCLANLGVKRRRSLKLLRRAVALMRQELRTMVFSPDAMEVKRQLASQLSNLGSFLWNLQGPGKAEACLREALELSEETDDVQLKQTVLRHLANMSSLPDQRVELAEAAALRSRMNTLYAQTGRDPDTSCMICLDPLEQPGGGAEEGAGAGGGADLAVHVLDCGHQLHEGCLSTWCRAQSGGLCCPVCKK